LELSTTEFFTWLSDDDLIHPGFFQVALTALDRDPLSVAFYSSYSTGLTWKPNLEPNCKEQVVTTFDKSTFLTTYASKKTSVIGCYGIFRRPAILAAGGFLQLGNGFSPYSDTLIPILLSHHGNIIYSHSQLVFLRTHKNSRSNSSGDLRSYTSSQQDFLTILTQLCSMMPQKEKDEILRDFFTWFSNDRAAVICRSSGFIGSLFSQVENDFFFLRNLEVKFKTKLYLLPTLIYRFIVSTRSLMKDKLMRHYAS
jgi:hypothetical protein